MTTLAQQPPAQNADPQSQVNQQPSAQANSTPPTAPPRPSVRAEGAPPPEPLFIKHRTERAAEHARKEILSKIGVSSLDELEKRNRERDEELTRLRKAEEDSKLSKMSDAERRDAQIEQMRKENEELRRQAEENRVRYEAVTFDTKVSDVAAQYINPSLRKEAVLRLRQELIEMRQKDPKAFNEFKKNEERSIERFYRQLARKNPIYAIPQAPSQEPAKAPPKPMGKSGPVRLGTPRLTTPGALRKPISSPAAKPPPSAETPGQRTDPTLINGKTILPGRPNSMTPAEVAAYNAELKRKHSGNPVRH